MGDQSGKARAALGSGLFLLVAPGIVAGLGPWLITDYEPADPLPVLQILGACLGVAGVLALLGSFARFVLEGIGTPAPVAPTKRLVVGGLYRYVRNPMYLAVGAIIVGQALVLGRYGLLAYAGAFFAIVASFVLIYEEPALEDEYGEEYRAYKRNVPGWWPRLRPWEP